MNPLVEVAGFGQSLWYDNISRGLITSGELRSLIEQDGIRGVTSNPAIFEKALNGSQDYDDALRELVLGGVETAAEIYEQLAVEDIALAADVLRPVWVTSGGLDGYVSLEVSPYLAGETEATIEEARRLFAAVGRDNVMIKVPATAAGLPAIRALIADGISVNVTLLFAVEAYARVADAYMSGLEELAVRGGDLTRVRSVASFFVSRIDTLVDERLERLLADAVDPDVRERRERLRGKVAIANAKLAYERYRELQASPRWLALASRGARPQRLLWASTSTKNPRYPKTLYVAELIGPDTVNTLPAETVAEFRAHGRVRAGLVEGWDEGIAEARATLAALGEAGVDFAEVTAALLADAIRKFSDPFDKLLAAIELKRQAVLGTALSRLTIDPGSEPAALASALESWRVAGSVRRLAAGDRSLWGGAAEDRPLCWLDAANRELESGERVKLPAEEARSAGATVVAVLGGGATALTTRVLAGALAADAREIRVLDSTLPAVVRRFTEGLDLGRTLFIAAGDPGRDAAAAGLARHFLDAAGAALGSEAGSRFLALATPGSELEKVATSGRFRRLVLLPDGLRGPWGALAATGTLAFTAAGGDTATLLARTRPMLHASAACVPPMANPGVKLGLLLATHAGAGRDKVTLVATPSLLAFAEWIAALLETALGGRLVAVAGEPTGKPEVYRADRVFVRLRLEADNGGDDRALDLLAAAGHPRLTLELPHALDVGQEILRWQVAVAVAAAELGVDPFAPATASTPATASLATPAGEADGFALFARPGAVAPGTTVTGALRAHLDAVGPGGHVAIHAALDRSRHEGAITRLRVAIRDRRRVATTVAWGPAPPAPIPVLAESVALQLTADEAEGTGPLAELTKRETEASAARAGRALRAHLGGDASRGLEGLIQLIEGSLG